MINKALEIAVKAHDGQFDKAGIPYITHPIRMALSLNDEDSRVVALLHDVVEDTNVTLKDLSNVFPPHIIEAVDAVTHRIDETYESYIQRVKVNSLAVRVKIADLMDNLSPEREYPGRKIERYHLALKTLITV